MSPFTRGENWLFEFVSSLLHAGLGLETIYRELQDQEWTSAIRETSRYYDTAAFHAGIMSGIRQFVAP